MQRIDLCAWIGCVALMAGSSATALAGGGGQNMLIVVNPNDEAALRVAQAYQQIRAIPEQNFVFITPRTDLLTTLSRYVELETQGDYFSYADHYLQPIADHIAAHNLGGQIDYIGGLSQPYRMSNNNGTSTTKYLSSSFTSTRMDALIGGATGKSLAGYVQATSMYQSPASYTRGGNTALHHDNTGLYMGGTVGFTGLFGNTPGQVIDGLQRAKNADGVKPTGTIYFEENNNTRSNTRESQWPGTKAGLTARGIPWIEESNVSGSTPRNRGDVRGAVVGQANLILPNGSTYLPGSWADNLTSNGTQFDIRTQTKSTAFIAAGAAGTGGTVAEPFAVENRFPHSNVHLYNADGSTLGEAFYKAVASPDLQLFLGDLLAQPYADVPDVQLTSAPAEGAAVSHTIQLQASASLHNPTLATGIARLELYIDGKLADTAAGAGATFNLDTTDLSDGHHELRVVAVNNAAAESEDYLLRHVVVNNDGRSVAVTGGPTNLAPTEVTPINVSAAAGSSTVQRIELRHLGRTIGQVAGGAGAIAVDAKMLAYGDNTVTPVAIYADGSQVAAAPITLTRDKPWMAGGTPTAPADRVPGIKAEYYFDHQGVPTRDSDLPAAPDLTTTHSKIFIGIPDDARSNLIVGAPQVGDVDPIAVSRTDAQGHVTVEHLDKLAIRLSGKFDIAAAAAGEYSFFFYKTQDAASLRIDGTDVLSFNNAAHGEEITSMWGASVFLAQGEHNLDLIAYSAANGRFGGYFDGFFDIALYYRGIDGITRVVDSSLIYQAVPEPASWMLLGLGGVLGGFRRRRG